MSDEKVSEQDAVTSLANDDFYYVLAGGASKKIKKSDTIKKKVHVLWKEGNFTAASTLDITGLDLDTDKIYTLRAWVQTDTNNAAHSILFGNSGGVKTNTAQYNLSSFHQQGNVNNSGSVALMYSDNGTVGTFSEYRLIVEANGFVSLLSACNIEQDNRTHLISQRFTNAALSLDRIRFVLSTGVFNAASRYEIWRDELI